MTGEEGRYLHPLVFPCCLGSRTTVHCSCPQHLQAGITLIPEKNDKGLGGGGGCRGIPELKT
jgi:hypothetical protein